MRARSTKSHYNNTFLKHRVIWRIMPFWIISTQRTIIASYLWWTSLMKMLLYYLRWHFGRMMIMSLFHNIIPRSQVHLRFIEVMQSPSIARFHDETRMDTIVFLRLLQLLTNGDELKWSRFSSAGQKLKLIIFLIILMGHSVRTVANHWQHNTSMMCSLIR